MPGSPDREKLRAAFQYLNQVGFLKTQRLPLVASRQWHWNDEREALERFRQGLANVSEVGVPRIYWKRESEQLRQLFRSLTLGLPDPEVAAVPELAPFFAGTARPRWSVVARFHRYILRSHPEDTGRDLVYFGDDTLFLMQRARELLNTLEGPVELLDLCCGGGGVGLALPDFEGQLLGVDLNSAAIELAESTAFAQELHHYNYKCWNIEQGLEGRYDFIFGNPPTLSPSLTGKDVFHATGTLEAFQQLLEPLLQALKPGGLALLTLFSQVNPDDEAFTAIQKTLKDRCGYRYEVRREFSIGSKGVLRHCALELYPDESEKTEFVPLRNAGIQLPALEWRRKP